MGPADFTVRLAVDAYKYRQGLDRLENDTKAWGGRLGEIGKGIGDRLIGTSFQKFGKALPLAAAGGVLASIGIAKEGISELAKKYDVAKDSVSGVGEAFSGLKREIGVEVLPLMYELKGMIETTSKGWRKWFDIVTGGDHSNLRNAIEADQQSRQRSATMADLAKMLAQAKRESVGLIADPIPRAVAQFNAEFKDAQEIYRKYERIGLGSMAMPLAAQLKANAAARLAPFLDAQMVRESERRAKDLQALYDERDKANKAEVERRRELASLQVDLLGANGYDLQAKQAAIVLDFETRIANAMADSALSAEERAAYVAKLRGYEDSLVAAAVPAARPLASMVLGSGQSTLANQVFQHGPNGPDETARQQVQLTREMRDGIAKLVEQTKVPYAAYN